MPRELGAPVSPSYIPIIELVHLTPFLLTMRSTWREALREHAAVVVTSFTRSPQLVTFIVVSTVILITISLVNDTSLTAPQAALLPGFSDHVCYSFTSVKGLGAAKMIGWF